MRTFEEVFEAAPAVRAAAPGRVNLLGEHTDYNEGLVLPTAIAQHTSVAIAKNALDRFRVYSAEFDKLCEFELGTPPAEHFATYVYGCLREFSVASKTIEPLDLHLRSTVPIGAGLSSSAALEIATLRALRELMQARVDDVELALMAQRAEIKYAGVNCGILDQMASSLARQGVMLFLDTRSLERELIPLPAGSELLVLHSGVERSLAATAYNMRRDECSEAARMLGVASLREATLDAALRLPGPFKQRARHVISENQRVLSTADGVDAEELGELMNASHASLRDDYAVSTAALDLLVALLQQESTVYGAKLTGAGFGGACVALCHEGAALQTAEKVLAAYKTQGQEGHVLVPEMAE